LMTIPGIGYYSALLIVSEIGISTDSLILIICVHMLDWYHQHTALVE
jgi:hypothetical protein